MNVGGALYIYTCEEIFKQFCAKMCFQAKVMSKLTEESKYKRYRCGEPYSYSGAVDGFASQLRATPLKCDRWPRCAEPLF